MTSPGDVPVRAPAADRWPQSQARTPWRTCAFRSALVTANGLGSSSPLEHQEKPQGNRRDPGLGCGTRDPARIPPPRAVREGRSIGTRTEEGRVGLRRSHGRTAFWGSRPRLRKNTTAVRRGSRTEAHKENVTETGSVSHATSYRRTDGHLTPLAR